MFGVLFDPMVFLGVEILDISSKSISLIKYPGKEDFFQIKAIFYNLNPLLRHFSLLNTT